MKTWLPLHILFRSTLPCLLLLVLCICSLQTSFAQVHIENQDTIIVSKTHSTGKCKVRMYANATHEVLFFTASGEEEKIYQLFMFDMEGRLVKQTAVRNRQTGFLAKFTKGNYVYEVFCNDERIENGKVVIK